LINFIQQLNDWSKQRIPFLFIIDYELKRPFAYRLTAIDRSEILFDVNGISNVPVQTRAARSLAFERSPMLFEDYHRKFKVVADALHRGESYLANLTIQTPVVMNLSLRELFFAAKAKYKLWFRNEFLVFSPESFVRIENGKIFSFPMKGTIDASVPNARETILNDQKEKAEHVTIVDLIRNDLSLVADNVSVNRFRYVDELKTSRHTLLQISSEISGELKPELALGDLLIKLLPAGSISGAPKKRTVQIIQQAEKEERGYFTGVFGIFDGVRVDSGVMIRFIENTPQGFMYRSGGGITALSDAEQEYKEAIDKIYAPVY
jgi:para-aminobenzoate synthetase component I